MDCRFTTTADGRTFICAVCGRRVLLATPADAAWLHYQCGRRPAARPTQRRPLAVRKRPSRRPRPLKQGSIAEKMARLLAAIAELPDLPPWPAIERWARHVCVTGAWAGCERGKADWARRVVHVASVSGVWPPAWGDYPAQMPPQTHFRAISGGEHGEPANNH